MKSKEGMVQQDNSLALVTCIDADRMVHMTYEEARNFIEQSNQYGSKLGLETVTELLSRLGNPQEQIKLIHVAGTNGKGSTTAFIASILAAEGYRVGRYISPAVFSYRERIQITDKVTEKITDRKTLQLRSDFITKQGICDAISAIKPICEAMVADGLSHPTSFELETAMAMLYFCQEQVDFAVIEVGLGGRLDATNTVKQPICSVITSISMDHMQFLGDTIEKIAGEKAGIIKEGRPVITGNTQEQVWKVLTGAAKEKHAPLILADSAQAELSSFSPEGTVFQYEGNEYSIRLLGKHQISNAVLAIKAAQVIREYGYHLSIEAIRQGLWLTSWSGRFEVIARKPYFIMDGAHNEDAALRLKDAITSYFQEKKLIFVLGVFADKDYQTILRITAPLANLIITLTPENARALPSSELAREAKKYCPAVIDGKTAEQAVKLAYEAASEEDVILAFGSLSFLGAIKRCVNKLTLPQAEHPDQEE